MIVTVLLIYDVSEPWGTPYNVDDLDLHIRSQWLDKGKQSTLNYLDNKASHEPVVFFNSVSRDLDIDIISPA